MNVDYDDPVSIWAAIPDEWWLNSETCKFMLACLVHKDNKDISSKPTKLPPGRPARTLGNRRKRILQRREQMLRQGVLFYLQDLSGRVMLTMQ